MPNIYQYTDYKKLLKDFYKEKKENNKHFSYQSFALRAGFRSKASLANITGGRYSLCKKKIFNVAKAMNLSEKEAQYFDALVNFTEAKSVSEREFHFWRMMNQAKNSDPSRLTEDQFEFYSIWYNCVIRELITINDFQDDYKALSKMVEPSITPAQAKGAVELLLRLKMVKRAPSGKYVQTEKVISTGDEVRSLGVQKYHQTLLSLAASSVDNHPKEARDISSLTAGISARGFHALKREIQQFRKHLMKIISDDEPSECVYQLGFQLFPLSKIPKHWSNENAR